MKCLRTGALGLGLLGMATAAAARDCAISAIEGAPIEIWAQGQWRDAVTGPLRAGDDVLRTGDAARVEIRCTDGLVVTVGIGTEVTLDALLAPVPGGLLMEIYRGIIGLVAPGRAPVGISVGGPLAIASVRSTEWLVSVGEDATTATFVREGRVAVAPRNTTGSTAVLGPGEGRDIRPGGAGDVVQWGAARVAATGAALGFDWP